MSIVIASGGAGTWFTFGYLMYVIVGVIGVAVSSLFYYYLEKVIGINYFRSIIAKHLLLMDIGTASAMGLPTIGLETEIGTIDTVSKILQGSIIAGSLFVLRLSKRFTTVDR